jgi:hypothetical protein
VCSSYYETSPLKKYFPYESRNARKEEKSSTDELPTRRFAVEFVLSYELLKIRKRRIFLPTSYIQGQVREPKEAVESAKAGLLPQEGDVKKGNKKKTKEEGLSPQEEDVRKIRKEKKKTKEGGQSP